MAAFWRPKREREPFPVFETVVVLLLLSATLLVTLYFLRSPIGGPLSPGYASSVSQAPGP